ncbi:MAG: 2-phosphosulfolactate phosphatase [Firmicutes bacterium]|mgnify:FL=1|nr:2-phosphosulfolactate phosphatase [Bacillota bacterium]
MRIDVALVPQEIEGKNLEHITAIVIDVLRASTCIANAIANDCDGVIPTVSVEEAMDISKAYARDDYLLCGERKNEKIDGFDLGNSPSEYGRDRVQGKKLIMTTTNGTRAIRTAKTAPDVIIGGFWNISACCELAATLNRDILIVCAGQNGRFAMEDTICAGGFAKKLSALTGAVIEETDGCRTARLLYETLHERLEEALSESAHGRNLIKGGFGEDVKVAARTDYVGVVPVFRDGHIMAIDASRNAKVHA